MTQHLDVEELLAVARGEQMSKRRLDVITAHCESCESCGDELAAALLLATSQAGTGLEARRHRGLAAAATVLLTVAIGAIATYFFTARGVDFLSFLRPSTTQHQVSGQESKSNEVGRLSDLATRESLPPVYLTLRFPGGIPASDQLILLYQALEALTDERYTEALERLEALHLAGPDATEVATYLGITRYVSGDRREPVGALLRAGSTHHRRFIRRWAVWYLANFHLRNNELEGAAALLLDLSAETSDRPGRLAQDLLKHFPSELR